MITDVGFLVAVSLLVLILPSGTQGSRGHHYDEKDGAHTIAKGTRKTKSNKPVDDLLYHESIKTDGTLFPFPTVQSHDICYPPKKSHNSKFTITAFNIADAGKGGLAYMKKNGGGVGKNKVCFHLQSERGKGYHFNIDVWGYYN